MLNSQFKTVGELAAANNGKVDAYAWPGGYPLYYLTKDGGVLCSKCVNENLESCSDPADPSWYVVGYDTHMEGPALVCDNDGTEIESAYGDPEPEESDVVADPYAEFRMDAADVQKKED